MENTYGVGIANRYELFLDEEEDPLEVLKLQEIEKSNKKKNKQTEKGVKAPDKVKAPKALKLIKETSVKSASVDRPIPAGNPPNDTNKVKINPKQAFDRKPKNVGDSRDERNNRRNRDDRPPQASGEFRGGYRPEGHRYIPRDGPREERSGLKEGQQREGARYGPREGLREGRGPRPDFFGSEEYRGRGARGGSYRGRGSRGSYRGRSDFENRPKREFGVEPNPGKQEQSRANEATTGNWEALKPLVDSGTPTEPEANVTAALTEGELESLTPIEPEPEELTLDEYKALRSSRQKPTFNLRKAGEGEDLTQWQTMYALTKNKVEEEEDDNEYDVLEYPQRVGRQKHLLDIDIRFADARRGSRGRGGRGGSHGGGFRGEGRGFGGPNPHTDDGFRSSSRGTSGDYRGSGTRGYGGERGNRGHRGGERGGSVDKHENRVSRQNAPKVDDEHDFPSLG